MYKVVNKSLAGGTDARNYSKVNNQSDQSAFEAQVRIRGAN